MGKGSPTCLFLGQQPPTTSVAQGLLLRCDEAKANVDQNFKLPPSHIWQCTCHWRLEHFQWEGCSPASPLIPLLTHKTSLPVQCVYLLPCTCAQPLKCLHKHTCQYPWDLRWDFLEESICRTKNFVLLTLLHCWCLNLICLLCSSYCHINGKKPFDLSCLSSLILFSVWH